MDLVLNHHYYETVKNHLICRDGQPGRLCEMVYVSGLFLGADVLRRPSLFIDY